MWNLPIILIIKKYKLAGLIWIFNLFWLKLIFELEGKASAALWVKVTFYFFTFKILPKKEKLSCQSYGICSKLYGVVIKYHIFQTWAYWLYRRAAHCLPAFPLVLAWGTPYIFTCLKMNWAWKHESIRECLTDFIYLFIFVWKIHKHRHSMYDHETSYQWMCLYPYYCWSLFHLLELSISFLSCRYPPKMNDKFAVEFEHHLNPKT